MLEQVGPYRLRDYLRLPEWERWELLEGELVMNPPPTLMHQKVGMRLAYCLVEQVEDAGHGWVFSAPTGVFLSDVSAPEPDVVMVRKEKRALMTKRAIEGAPDVVVEVLSPSTKKRDLQLKRRLYAKYGIGEYWVVHPDEAWVEVLVLQRGRYVRKARLTPPDVLRTDTFPTVAVPLEQVFRPL